MTNKNEKTASWGEFGDLTQKAVSSRISNSNPVHNNDTTPNNNVNLDTDWDHKRSNTIALLRNLQVGNPPSGITPQDCIYPDSVAEVLRASEASGIVAALKTLEATPDLYRLVCEAETPSPAAAILDRSTQKIDAEVGLHNHTTCQLLLAAAACFLLTAAIALWPKLTVSFKSTYQTGG